MSSQSKEGIADDTASSKSKSTKSTKGTKKSAVKKSPRSTKVLKKNPVKKTVKSAIKSSARPSTKKNNIKKNIPKNTKISTKESAYKPAKALIKKAVRRVVDTFSKKSAQFNLTDDPFQKREADHYSNPIPSREYILQVLESVNKPLDSSQLCRLFELSTDPNDDAHIGLIARLSAMVRDGQLLLGKRQKYTLLNPDDLSPGVIRAVKHGLVVELLQRLPTPKPKSTSKSAAKLGAQSNLKSKRKQKKPDAAVSGNDPQISLSYKEMQKVMVGDAVSCLLLDNGRGGFDAKVVSRTAAAHHSLLGRVMEQRGEFWFEALNPNIKHKFVVTHPLTAEQKERVVRLNITKQPWIRQHPEGEIIEVLGDYASSEVQLQSIIETYELPCEWPDAVEDGVKELPSQVDVGKITDMHERQDLRSLPFMTIDGKTAKDFDDALYCEQLPDGWRLVVAIADVDYYVPPHSALDNEAQKRGNSIYFPQQVIPMLPEILSNNLCSLVPNQPRLAMVADMRFDARGERQSCDFSKGLIQSQARLTYEQVQDFVDADFASDALVCDVAVMDSIRSIHQLYQQLLLNRSKNGLLDFDSCETRYQLTGDALVESIDVFPRLTAHRIIEEAMLSANQAVAGFLVEKSLPGIFRNHEQPNDKKRDILKTTMKSRGIDWRFGDEPTLMDYYQLQQQVNGHSDSSTLNIMILRSMMAAAYSTTNEGHFGLGYEHYVHFTSPIRRYPDLVIHRILKQALKTGKPSSKKAMPKVDALDDLAQHLSFTERRAEEATRRMEAFLKCQYLSQRLGDTFPGKISTVTGFGLFVQLDGLMIDGLIHINTLNDYFEHDADKQLLKGKRTNKVYRVGDPLQVQVDNVSLQELRIDFALVT